MKLKLDENGNVVVKDEMPVYTTDDGQEMTIDAATLMSKNAALNKENTERRHKNNELEEQLKVYDGIDPVKAKDAMEKISTIDANEMVAKGEVETLKKEMAAAYEGKITEQKNIYEEKLKMLTEGNAGLQGTVNHLMVSNSFSNSPWFTGENPKTILPPDMAAEIFGKYFKVEGQGKNVKIVGYKDDEVIRSKRPERIGEPADFEEAISVIVDSHPMKERFLKSTPGGSQNAHGNLDSDGSGSVVLTKTQAKDFSIYKAAKKKAADAGVGLRIVEG